MLQLSTISLSQWSIRLISRLKKNLKNLKNFSIFFFNEKNFFSSPLFAVWTINIELNDAEPHSFPLSWWEIDETAKNGISEFQRKKKESAKRSREAKQGSEEERAFITFDLKLTECHLHGIELNKHHLKEPIRRQTKMRRKKREKMGSL